MSEHQPFFQAFVNAHQDHGQHIGVDFVPWIGRQWRDYFVSTGRSEMSQAMHDDFPRFTAWLEAKYPTPPSRNAQLKDSPSSSPSQGGEA